MIREAENVPVLHSAPALLGVVCRNSAQTPGEIRIRVFMAALCVAAKY